MEEDEYRKVNGEYYSVSYIAFEYAHGGELFDFIAETGRFDEDVARFFFHQIIDAVEYLHVNGVSH